MCHMAHKGFSTNLNYFQVPVVILVLGMLNVPVLFTEFSECSFQISLHIFMLHGHDHLRYEKL